MCRTTAREGGQDHWCRRQAESHSLCVDDPFLDGVELVARKEKIMVGEGKTWQTRRVLRNEEQRV